MNIVDVVTARQKIDVSAEARFCARAEPRTTKLAAVEAEGVLAAAGIGPAVRRALQLTVAEGRGAVMPATGAEPVPQPGVAAPADRALESIVGFNDIDQINFLDHGLCAARAVCRLLVDGQPIGTGFLVAPGVLLTNHHVIPDADAARGFVAQFDYALDGDDDPLRPVRFALDPARLFVTSPADAFDCSFIAVAPAAATGEPLARFGWLPLAASGDKILEGEPVIIVQHPQGREKALCLFHSEMVDRHEQYIYYTTDTEVGSSGSPGFNRQWQVVALHHASAPSGTMRRGVETAANEGVRISAILQALQAGDRMTGDATGLYAVLADPATQGSGRPRAPMAAVAAAPRPVSAPILERRGVAVRPASWFTAPERPGYDPLFLGEGFAVPLPTLPPALADDVTRLVDGSAELRYTHYSVVMCASRRLAWFSAANVRGRGLQSLARTDRDPDHPAAATAATGALEAADIWWLDGRIAATAQVGGDIYDMTDFDYGHLTRRLDPVWGDPRTLRIANDDTFYLTNCTPQAHQLNTVTWAHLENAVRNAATTSGADLIVITGPVLDPRDPVILDVACPTAYWKIVARIEAGRLAAHGFVQWQTDLVAAIGRRFEQLDPLARAEEWHVPISDIVRLTALDFGPLLAADSKVDPAPERLTPALVDDVLSPAG